MKKISLLGCLKSNALRKAIRLWGYVNCFDYVFTATHWNAEINPLNNAIGLWGFSAIKLLSIFIMIR